MTNYPKFIFKAITILTLNLGVYIHHAIAQVPTAQFTSNFTADCSPFTVNFTDQSTNSPISWHWDFGNGNTSSDKNPSAVYKNPGTYTVTLSVSNIDGGDIEKKTNYITVYQNPSSNYTSDFSSGCNPLAVQFTDKSTNGSGTINSWSWDAGDGTIYASKNPKHTYTVSGSYNVSLTVKDNNGCQSKFFIEDYVKVSTPPSANFTGSPLSSCTSNLTSTFTNLTSQGSDPITNWHWNFGDGATSTQQNPSHTHTNFGNYDVLLVAIDQNNCTDSIKFTKYVNLSNFIADFDTSTTITCPDLSVLFTDKSSETPATLFWDFGDGNTSTSKPSVGNAYKTSGSFDVKLIAVDPFGCKDSILKSDLIVFNRVNAAYSVDSTRNCELPFTVNFTNSSSGQNPLLYEWRSDTGSLIDNSKNFTFTYNAEGVYYPSLKLTDDNGCTDSLNLFQKGDSIVIIKPVVGITSNFTAGCTTLAVSFFDISTSPIGNINQWLWDFGDPASGASNTSTLKSPSHSYATDGKFSVSLTITNVMGCTESVTKIDYIAVGYEPDTVWFAKLEDTVCHGQTVQFYDSSKTKITQWLWIFTDNITEISPNPSHEFQDTGWIKVTLQAGYNGCLLFSETDSVYVLPPKPDFYGSPIMPCNPPYEVNFTDLSRAADSWFWKIFDDADTVIVTSTDTNPVVSLPGPGFYDIELVVTNPNGCKDSIKRGSYIQITGLKSNFGVDTSQLLENCYSLQVAFTDSATSNFTIYTWQWFFGDGKDTLISRFDPFFTGIKTPAPHLYSDTGKYDVTLTVSDASGCSRSFTRDDYVTVHGTFANFTSDTVTFCVPYTVNFTDVSSTTNTVVDWDWDFGDGNIDTSNTPSPSNSYILRGVYDVKLSVEDVEGCKHNTTIKKYITGTFPYPSFTFKSNKKGCLDEVVDVTSTSTGTGMTYVWNWGDTSNRDTTRNAQISHAWEKDSTYFFTLTVIDTNGCDSSFTDSIIVVPDPMARIGIDSIYVDCPPLPVSFADSSFTSKDDQITSWYWKFEKGKISTAQHPSYTYLKADTFDVFLAVQTLVGCKDTLLLIDTIIVGGPNGSFVMSPLQCCVPCTATFNVTTKNNFTQIWDFGDGNSDTIPDTDSLIWIYKSAANPHPLLLLDDGQGCNELIADEPTPDSIIIADPVAGFFMDNYFLCEYDSVSFADTSTTNNPSISITGWKWFFGDGDSSTSQFPSHYFGDTGFYTITLYITNELNKCVVSESEIIEVNSKPKVQISIDGFEGCVPFEVQFDDASESKSPITYRQWEFGDGYPYENTKNPNHIYNQSGYYIPKLILYYGDSVCAAWVTSGKLIKAYDTPVGDFDIDSSLTNFKTLDIYFSNQSIINNSIGSHSYLWDFGDPLSTTENTSTLESPTHTYFDIGDYNVAMIISNDACSDTVLKSYYFDNSEFSAPNVFTPKPSSPGINDVFYITGISKESHLMIFDRWGKKVYDVDNYLNNWDGGTLPADTYFYILTNERKNKNWKGFVRLIRENGE